ncbi:MAG: hypothetical protein M3Q64_00845 [bacterium]|nr:hypothetical protein [bacterium]
MPTNLELYRDALIKESRVLIDQMETISNQSYDLLTEAEFFNAKVQPSIEAAALITAQNVKIDKLNAEFFDLQYRARKLVNSAKVINDFFCIFDSIPKDFNADPEKIRINHYSSRN